MLAFYNLAKMHASGWGVMRACHTAVEVRFVAIAIDISMRARIVFCRLILRPAHQCCRPSYYDNTTIIYINISLFSQNQFAADSHSASSKLY